MDLKESLAQKSPADQNSEEVHPDGQNGMGQHFFPFPPFQEHPKEPVPDSKLFLDVGVVLSPFIHIGAEVV